MIREKSIARIFAVFLLIGIISVGYVMLTQPIGMVVYEDAPEPEIEKETMSQEEVLELFDEHWDEVEDQLFILEEELE